MQLKQLQNKLIIGFILAMAVFVAVGFYADFKAITRLLQDFAWVLLPVILSLTFFNYLLRFSKWHYYIRQIGIKNLSVWDDARVYFGGFGLSLTPGKVGELVRMLWLKNLTGVNPARTVPVAFAERLTDGIAMVLITLLGSVVYPQFRPAAMVIGSALAVAVIVIQIRPLALWFIGMGERLPFVAKFAHSLHELYESAYELLQLKNLFIAVGLGSVAWISQGIAFYLVLVGLGEPPSTQLAFLSVFILASATVVGGASGVPGGLGVTEGGLIGLLLLLAGLPEDVAATAALLIRFCTMWFGVLLGLSIIAIWHKFLFGESVESLDEIDVLRQSEG